MKKFGRTLCALALATATCGALATPAFAGPIKEYTVRVYAGNEGTVNGKSVDQTTVSATTPSQDPGRVNLRTQFPAEVNDNSKYYVKGYRISGKDSNDQSFENNHVSYSDDSSYMNDPYDGLVADVPITESTDFIVAYGVRGNMENVTIRFVVQGTGQELGTRTVEGKVGDRIVEGYEYFDNYRPLYRNITGTVKDSSTDANANVWTLEYVPVTSATSTTTTEGGTTTTVTTVTGGGGGTTTTTVTGGGGGGTDNGGTTTTTTDNGGDTGDNGGNGGNGGNASTTTTVQEPPATQEILDVDNPLASPDGQEGGDNGTTNSGDDGNTQPTEPNKVGFAPIPFVLVILALIALAGFTLFRILSKSSEDDDEEDDE